MGKEGDPGNGGVWRLVRVALGTAVAGALMAWLETWWWWGDVAACFRPVFALVLGAGVLVSWWRGWTGWALVCGVLSLTYPLQRWPGHRELPPAGKTEQGGVVTVYCHNIHGSNRRASEELEEIRRLSPDIAVLIEVDSWWAEHLLELEETYPYHLVEARDGYFGMAIFSRIPLSESGIRDFSGYELPSVLVRFEVGGQKVRLIGTHPPPPVNAFSFRIRNWHLAELAREARLGEEPLIVVGDFNSTPWSAAMGRFLRNSGLGTSPVSRENTWSPVQCAWLGFPIDYQLAAESWRVVRWETGNFLGSDHRWTLTGFQLPARRR